MKTYSAKPGEVTKRWYVVDAEGEILGRLATRIATVLRGKHKPQFTPHVDTGDFVVVINAEKIALSGNKLSDKWYRHHSGYPGGLKSLWYEKLLETHPERAIQKAVWGMLPKTSLGRKQLRKLKVYRGAEHPHLAQKPEPFPGTGTGRAPAGEALRQGATEDEAAHRGAAPDQAAAEPTQTQPPASADAAPTADTEIQEEA